MFRFVWQVVDAESSAARAEVVFVQDEGDVEGAVDVTSDDGDLRGLVRYHLLDLAAVRAHPKTLTRIDALMNTFTRRYPAWRVIRTSVVPPARPPLDAARLATLRARVAVSDDAERDPTDDEQSRLFTIVALEDERNPALREWLVRDVAELDGYADYQRAMRVLDGVHAVFVEYLGPVDPSYEEPQGPAGLRHDALVLRAAARSWLEYIELARGLDPVAFDEAAVAGRAAHLRGRVEAARRHFLGDQVAVWSAAEQYRDWAKARR
jgi:hypothetical protein